MCINNFFTEKLFNYFIEFSFKIKIIMNQSIVISIEKGIY